MSRRQCWSERCSATTEPAPQPAADSGVTAVASMVVCETERTGALDSTDGTLIGTSTQSLQDGLAGTRSECSSSCETASEQQPHDHLSATVGPLTSVQTTKPSPPAVVLRTSSAASMRAVAAIEGRGRVFIDCRVGPSAGQDRLCPGYNTVHRRPGPRSVPRSYCMFSSWAPIHQRPGHVMGHSSTAGQGLRTCRCRCATDREAGWYRWCPSARRSCRLRPGGRSLKRIWWKQLSDVTTRSVKLIDEFDAKFEREMERTKPLDRIYAAISTLVLGLVVGFDFGISVNRYLHVQLRRFS